jgi:hypothetical protein
MMLPVFGIGSSSNGLLERGAAIQLSELTVHMDVCLPRVFVVTPNALNASTIMAVEGAGSDTKVNDAIVGSLSVDMVENRRGLNPIVEEVCKPVGQILSSLEGNVPVSILRDGACYRADNRIPVYLLCPSKLSCIGTVVKVLTHRVWDNFCSHIKLPLDLVRGTVASTAVTPTIT